MSKVAPSFSFDPRVYREIRLAGTKAFRSLVQHLEAKELIPEEHGDVSPGNRYLRERIPPGENDPLPMRTLVGFGTSLDSGELNELVPIATDEAVIGFEDWRRGYAEDFARFFPEQRNVDLPDRQDWMVGGRSGLWEALRRTSKELAGVLDRPHDRIVCFYALLRDNVEELGQMAGRLGIDLDALTRAVFEAPGDRGSILAVRGQYDDLWARNDIRHGPELAFVAFALDGLEFAARAGGEWGREPLLEVAREVAGEGREVEALGVTPEALGDLPAGNDRIGMAPLVRGMRALLENENTQLPLAIGVHAPWGGGKSSLMLQLRRALMSSESSRRQWIPVNFDAWKFEDGEKLWAALAKAVYEQTQESWSLWRWTRFKVRLEVRRRGKLDFWLRFTMLLSLLAFTVLAALTDNVGAPAALAGLALFTAGIGDTLGRAWGVVGDPFKRAIDSYAARYERRLGFTSEADADIQAMIGELTRDSRHAVIVFVDDLDRCSPRHIVDVVEAINQIFNADQSARCAFVLGMDREIVAAGIEVAYRDMIRMLPVERRRNFGLSFLAKLVQISITIPPPRREVIDRLMKPEPAPAPAFDADEPFEDFDVWVAEGTWLRYLDPNPREIKRFRNAFRLQLHVASRSDGHELRFDLDDLQLLAKSVFLRIRWPDLAEAIDRDPGLLGRLEASREVSPGGASLNATESQWLKDELLAKFLGQGPSLSELARQAVLRVS